MNLVKPISGNDDKIEISSNANFPSLREIKKKEKKIGPHEEIYIAKGAFYFNQKDFLKARYYLERAIEFNPTKQAFVVLMKILNKTDTLHDIIDNFRRSEKKLANDPIFYQLWGYAQFELKNFQEAYEKFLKAKDLGLEEDLQTENINFIVRCLKNSKMIGETYSFTKSLIEQNSINETIAEAFTSACVTLDRTEEIVDFLETTDFDWTDCSGVNGYGAIGYYISGKSLEKSVKLNEKALLLDPDKIEIRWNTSLAQLRIGKLEEGISNYSCRWDWEQFPSPRRTFSKPKFTEDVDPSAKILVWTEQGIGDEVLFTSSLEDFKKEYPNLIFETHPKTLEIMKNSFKDVEVRMAEFNTDLTAMIEDFDYHIPIGDVYHRLVSKNLPAIKKGKSLKGKHYLKPDTLRREYWKNKLNDYGDKPKIGICWKSSNLADGRYRDHTELEVWKTLLERDDANFVSLQYNHDYEDVQNEYSDLSKYFLDTGYLDQMNDLEGAVALISNLDLVISSAASPFSIAPAAGTQTWFFSRPNPFMAGRFEKFSQHPILDRLYNYVSYNPYDDEDLVNDFRDKLDKFILNRKKSKIFGC